MSDIGFSLTRHIHTIYKGARLMSSWCANGPPGASYDVSDSVWMEGENFYQWFVKYFIPHVQHLSGFKLLFLDGHALNNSYVCKKCL